MFKSFDQLSCPRLNAMESRSSIGPQILAAVSCTFILVSGGFQFGWSSPSLPKLQAEDSDIPVTSDQGSWIASLMTCGCIFGPLISAAVVDRWGRKLSLLLTVIPLLSSCILTGFARNYIWLYAARFIGGLGVGAMYNITPMYLGEIAEDRIRGGLGVLITCMLNLGILLTYSVGPFVDRATLAGLGAIVPILFVLIFAWMPETPYHHCMTRRSRRAEKSLIWLRGMDNVVVELKTIEENVEFDQRNVGTFRELFIGRGNQKALIIIIGLLSAQQLTGIGAVQAYSSLIFEESGSELDSSISVIITGIVQLLAGILSLFLVDKAGRRPLLLISVSFTALFLVGEALYFQLQANGTDVTSLSWLPVTSIIGYMISHSIGINVLPYAILSEIFPCNVKALATMLAGIWGAVSGMAVTKLYQVVADAYGIHAAFWGFAVIACFSGVFVCFVVPETKGRSLRDIQDELQTGSGSNGVLEKPTI